MRVHDQTQYQDRRGGCRIDGGRKPLSSKPKPQTKVVWGSLSEGPEKTVAGLAESVTERLCWASELVCILDGEKSL